MSIPGSDGYLNLRFARSAKVHTGIQIGLAVDLRRRYLMPLKTTRVDVDTYLMLIAKTAALRSTCLHREQGAVIVRDNRVISTGYNGQPPGARHCIDFGWCAKGESLPCRAEGLHAESNAIASAAKLGVSTNGTTMYCVYSPCMTCCNLIKSAGIVCVKYLELYPGFLNVSDYLNSIDIVNAEVKSTEALGWNLKLG